MKMIVDEPIVINDDNIAATEEKAGPSRSNKCRRSVSLKPQAFDIESPTLDKHAHPRLVKTSTGKKDTDTMEFYGGRVEEISTLLNSIYRDTHEALVVARDNDIRKFNETAGKP